MESLFDGKKISASNKANLFPWINSSVVNTLLEKFWRISLYLTDDAIAKLFALAFSQLEGSGRKLSHIKLSNIVLFVKCSNSVVRH